MPEDTRRRGRETEASIRSMRRGYVLALSILALLTVLAQLFVQQTLGAQLHDAEIINVAGRQRMLSQRIARGALELRSLDHAGPVAELLRDDLETFARSHERLMRGDLGAFAHENGADTVRALDRRHATLLAATRHVLARPRDAGLPATSPAAAAFLSEMDDAVFRYSAASEAALIRTQRIEIGLALVTLAVLILEALLIFGPLLRRLQGTVAELRELAERLVISKGRYARAVSGSRDGIFDWHRDRDELYASARFREIAGLGEGPLGWSDLAARLVPRDQEALREALASGTLRLELQLRAGDDLRWIELVGQLEGQHVAGTIRDVDERRQLEAERERLLQARDRALERTREDLAQAQLTTAMGTFASGVAHDFNNYLQVIRLAAASIQPSEDDHESLSMIETAAEEASDLVRELQALRRDHSGMSLAPLGLARFLEDSQQLVRHALPANIELRLALAEELPMVHADSGQLRQVLINLCLNARDAMPHGGRVVLSAHPSRRASVDGPREGVEICVGDDGEGMSPETQRQAFMPFFSTKEPGKGTGLGLAMVQSIVVRHGGMVDLESARGAGTRVRIWLPVGTSEAVDTEPPREHWRRSAQPLAILFVDDEPGIRRLGVRLLERRGHRVVSAGSAGEALEHLRAEEFDAIVCDVMLPDGRGPELVERARVETKRMTPALFISGYSDTPVKADGSLAYLRKPFSPAELLDHLDQLLARAARDEANA